MNFVIVSLVFSRLRQLAERSDYFRSELRSMNQQTWFLPNDQAFASMGSSLSSLLDQSNMNSLNDINEVGNYLCAMVFFSNEDTLVCSSTCHTVSDVSQCNGFDETSNDIGGE